MILLFSLCADNCKKCASILHTLDWYFLTPSTRNAVLASVILQDLIIRDSPTEKSDFLNAFRTLKYIFGLNPTLVSNKVTTQKRMKVKDIIAFVDERILKPFLTQIVSVCEFSVSQVEDISQLPALEQAEETVLSIMQVKICVNSTNWKVVL